MWLPIDYLHFGPRQLAPGRHAPVESGTEGIFRSLPPGSSLPKLAKPSFRFFTVVGVVAVGRGSARTANLPGEHGSSDGSNLGRLSLLPLLIKLPVSQA